MYRKQYQKYVLKYKRLKLLSNYDKSTTDDMFQLGGAEPPCPSPRENNEEEIVFTRSGNTFNAILIGGIKNEVSKILRLYCLQMNNVIKKEKIKKPEFNIYICSGGGAVIAGISMYNSIMELNNSGIKTTAIADGIVGSAATFPYLACDHRKAHRNDRFLFHLPTTNTCGLFRASELRDEKKNMDDILLIMKGIYKTRTQGKMTEKIISNQMKDELCVSSEQCIKWGVVTEKKLL